MAVEDSRDKVAKVAAATLLTSVVGALQEVDVVEPRLHLHKQIVHVDAHRSLHNITYHNTDLDPCIIPPFLRATPTLWILFGRAFSYICFPLWLGKVLVFLTMVPSFCYILFHTA